VGRKLTRLIVERYHPSRGHTGGFRERLAVPLDDGSGKWIPIGTAVGVGCALFVVLLVLLLLIAVASKVW
jgi:hypothetical protein